MPLRIIRAFTHSAQSQALSAQALPVEFTT